MIQEDKELLLKDLSARLPYRVKVLCLRDFNHDWYNLEMVNIQDNEVYVTTYEPYANRYVKIEEVKPYLFPLSSITEEQKQELNNLVEESVFQIIHSEDGNPQPQIPMDWYNKNHFDYRGLIPKGLAIDATGLNVY